MVFITLADVTEFAPNEFWADASDLGLPPGTWPETLETDLGNKLKLRRIALDEGRGLYRQDFGCVELSIMND